MKVYGPYTRKDGRKHVILYDPATKKKTTVSYPKYLMEQHLGRKLTDNEHVDHIDEDFTNDTISNLQVLTKKDHYKKSAKARPKAEIGLFQCPTCLVYFERQMRDVRHNQEKYKKAGPFCSKSCSGIYGTDLQYSTK